MAVKKRARTMSAEHKAALAEGREQGRKVRRYLEALESTKPKRGRKRTPDSIRRRLTQIDRALEEANPLTRVQLMQERIDLQRQLAAGKRTVDLKALEDDFVDVALHYSARKGITYAAWREAGVSAATLKKAGISRSMQ